MSHSPSSLSLFAPAKINLFLHVIGKRDDGYHKLQSLVAFADIGDTLSLQESDVFSFTLSPEDSAAPRNESNLVVRAVHAAAEALQISPAVAIHLNKNIPIGAGLGGGSADAAAIIKAFMEQNGKSLPEKELESLLLSLGADVPVCYRGKPAFVEGIGDKITTLTSFPTIPVILVRPNISCATAEIFKNFGDDFSAPITCPGGFNTPYDLLNFLTTQQNDLTRAAITVAPIIQDVLNNISTREGCTLSRMSGSGSCCFGLFETIEQAERAVQKIKRAKPDWWVQSTTIG